MSSRLAVCPRCRHLELHGLLDELTGTGRFVTAADLHSLRESWNSHMKSSGTFLVTYSCTCDQCGFKFEYDYEADVDVLDPDYSV